MKRFTVFILAAALLLGSLAGCGSAKAVSDDISQLPPAMILTDGDNDEILEVEPAGYQWVYPVNGGKNAGVNADAVHPLDPTAADVEQLWFVPEADAVFSLSFERSPVSVYVKRWSTEDIGNTQAEPAETAVLNAPFKTALQPGSVYQFHVDFGMENNCGGDAEYRILIPREGELEDEPEDELMVHKPFSDEETFYWQTEEYKAFLEAIQQSTGIRDTMDAYYSRVLPLLLSGDENSVCSPLNLYLALSMLAETAGGESREAILAALNAPDLETVRRNAAMLYAANCYDIGGARCLLGSSLWLNDCIPSRQEVADALAEYHKAEVYSGVMGTDELDQQLRDWINEKTMDLLKEFTAGLSTQPETVMELVTAMYFKASWANEFSAKFTDRATFHGLKGDAECDMMHRSVSMAYYWGDNFTAVCLSFNVGGSMFFILPDEGVSLESILTDPQVAALLREGPEYANQKHVIVEMSIPKFDVKSNTDLRTAMTAMGMGGLFDIDTADFTPLTEDFPIYLSQAEHAAGVFVDEDGVTGAAYTVFGLTAGAAPPSEKVQFTLDRPFMFAVEAQDGSLLFAGTITDLGE